jgi:hypothetical protein
MRNRKWVLISAIGLLSILIGQGIYADFRSGSNNPAVPETIHQSLPAAASPNATYSAGQNPGQIPELASGNGKDEVEYNCGLCHSLSYITMRPPISAEGWAREVNMMRGFYGASMSDGTARKISQYLGSHYTPETLKR